MILQIECEDLGENKVIDFDLSDPAIEIQVIKPVYSINRLYVQVLMGQETRIYYCVHIKIL